ncbi:gp77 [Brochothrix phage A9]|uniref:Gp77 n=1 Tax=Brochothrix phage A9 TaxID=857312 RepID=D9J0M4_9CAUD|nr:gp77 [Brochothrix phage A9]ADJ53117.1 gp77 [Brochothrix phage A9]
MAREDKRRAINEQYADNSPSTDSLEVSLAIEKLRSEIVRVLTEMEHLKEDIKQDLPVTVGDIKNQISAFSEELKDMQDKISAVDKDLALLEERLSNFMLTMNNTLKELENAQKERKREVNVLSTNKTTLIIAIITVISTGLFKLWFG